MSKLQLLNVFLTDRLTLAAREIFKAVEDIVSEYNEELCRSRQEIELLRRRLQLDSDTQSCSFETRDTQTFSEDQWRSEQDGKDTEVHMKLEVYSQQDESRVQMCNESTSLPPCMKSDRDQTTSKDIETQLMDNNDDGFPFINHAAQIKNEPGLHSEKHMTCTAQYFTTQSSDDTDANDASSNQKSEVHSPAHRTQTCNLLLTNPEMMMQRKMELAQMRERLTDDETKKAAAKTRSLKHKLKVSGNPELLEAYRKKERERYQRRKSQGKVKSAKDLNPLELRRQQKRWRENSAVYRRKKAFQEVLDHIKDMIPDKLQTQQEANQSNNLENEEMHKVKKVRHSEEVALDNEQHHQTQPKTNLADICLDNIQHEEELSENYHSNHDLHGNTYGTGDYFCVVCHRRFSSSGLLKIHLRIHSGEKPYHCSFCGKNFRQSSHLKTHVRIHTGERPHMCQNCGRTFIDSSARNRHFKKCILIALQGQ